MNNLLNKDIQIAGAVILYHPDYQCINNIETYINQIDFLFIIDNSEVQNVHLINELNKFSSIFYLCNQNNYGIAHALNQAADLAKERGFDFLLTMDQDTTADATLVDIYKSFLSSMDYKNIGI